MLEKYFLNLKFYQSENAANQYFSSEKVMKKFGKLINRLETHRQIQGIWTSLWRVRKQIGHGLSVAGIFQTTIIGVGNFDSELVLRHSNTRLYSLLDRSMRKNRNNNRVKGHGRKSGRKNVLHIYVLPMK